MSTDANVLHEDCDVSVDYGESDAEVDATIDAASQANAGEVLGTQVTLTVPVLPLLPAPSEASGADAFAPISEVVPPSGEGSAVTPPRTAAEMVVEQAAVTGDRSGVPVSNSGAQVVFGVGLSEQALGAALMDVDTSAQGSSSAPAQVPETALPSTQAQVDSVLSQEPAHPVESNAMSADVPSAGTGDGEAARTERVQIGNRWYVPPSTYDQIDIHGQDEQARHAMAKAPWFERDAITAAREYADNAPPGEEGRDSFLPYLNARGRLPGDLPRSTLDSWVWRRVFCASDADLYKDGTEMHKIRNDFVHHCLKGLQRLLNRDEMEEAVSDLFVYRTRGEMPYVEELDGLAAARIQDWAGGCYASDDALLLTRPLLQLDFRYRTKRCDFLLEQVAEERSLTTWYKLLIPYWAPQAVSMNRAARRNAFVNPTAFWDSIQLPAGCLVELPTVVSHTLSRIRNRNSGWWVVVYTEYTARAAAFILSEVYDSLILWYVPPALRALIRSLDLSWVLGNESNVEELGGLLDVIAGTNFTHHAPAQRLRLAGFKDPYPTRRISCTMTLGPVRCWTIPSTSLFGLAGVCRCRAAIRRVTAGTLRFRAGMGGVSWRLPTPICRMRWSRLLLTSG